MDGMTRRSALLAAAALSLSATESQAGEPGQSGEAKKLLLLHIVLPDGQAIDLKASEATIDFGTAAKLAVTPSGVLPVAVVAEKLNPAGIPSDAFEPRVRKPFNAFPPQDDLNNPGTRVN